MIKVIIFDLWETLGTKNVGISKTLQSHFNIPKDDEFLRKYEKAIKLKECKNQDEMAENFLKVYGSRF